MMTHSAYKIPVWDTITTAWHKVHGSKKTFWAAIGVMFLIIIGIAILQGIASFIGGKVPANIISGIGNAFLTILEFGFIFMGIYRAANLPINYKQLFLALNWQIIFYLIGLYVIKFLIYIPVAIVIAIGTMLMPSMLPISMLLFIIAFIAGLIISVRLIIALPLVLDQRMKPWDAIKTSFEKTRHNFWHIIGIFFLQVCIIAISMIPLGIGLIWTIPFSLINFGLVYRRLNNQASV